MEFSALILLHVFFGIVWAGGAIVAGLFLVPSVMDAGPAGGAVMAGMLKRRFPMLMTISAALVVLSGLRLYAMRFSMAFLGTTEGIALTLGGLLGLGAFFIGSFVQGPTARRLGALGAQMSAGGSPPTPEQAAEMQALRTRLGKVATLTAWHVVLASLLMAGHRLAAMIG
ncbi:MAG: hypothetical protein AB7T31_10690 [Gemmatimonadales bacterium]